MAIVIKETNALILEPVKCGTTWTRSVLTECGVDWELAPSVAGVCPRHSYLEHYKGEFSQVYCAIRNPYSWMVSYYNFCRSLRTLPYEENVFYGHRPFGKSMPLSFEDFVEATIMSKGVSVSSYFRPFLECHPTILRQERLRSDLSLLLKSQGVSFDEEILMNSKRENTSSNLYNWSQVSGGLLSSFRRQEAEILSHYQDAPNEVN